MKKLFFITRGEGREKGFILLLAMLIISIVLAISFGIYALSIKEVILASYAKESVKAFGAADRGVECAVYWDRVHEAYTKNMTIFATSSASATLSAGDTDDIHCQDIHIGKVSDSGWNVSKTATAATTTFRLSDGDGTCADTIVAKFGAHTTVVSNGYNTCNVNNPRRIQRTIQVSYDW